MAFAAAEIDIVDTPEVLVVGRHDRPSFSHRPRHHLGIELLAQADLGNRNDVVPELS